MITILEPMVQFNYVSLLLWNNLCLKLVATITRPMMDAPWVLCDDFIFVSFELITGQLITLTSTIDGSSCWFTFVYGDVTQLGRKSL